MMRTYFITATDTDAGKTMTSAALMKQYSQAHYWKPVQTGADRDLETVRFLSGASSDRFHSGMTFSEPLSPHRAAELDRREIQLEDLDQRYERVRHQVQGNAKESAGEEDSILFIEGAGGLLVPLNRQSLWPGWLEGKDLSIILVCRTGLGTINHTLLSVEAIRARNLQLAGIVFFGPENPDNQRTIQDFTGATIIGQFDWKAGAAGAIAASDAPALPAALDRSGLLLEGSHQEAQ